MALRSEEKLSAALSPFARFGLLDSVTPLQTLHRLNALPEVRGVRVHVKRDDLAAQIGGGGNKLRKLEFLVADALAQGCDTVITVGGRQSNHARLTAAAAARAGLRCELVLNRSATRNDEDFTHNGNFLLDEIFGARIHDLPVGADSLAFAKDRAQALMLLGHKVYVCPLAGSSPLGCLGYVACALELLVQTRAQELKLASVVVPNGSGGSHAGLLAGFTFVDMPATLVKGYSVLSTAENARKITLEKANAALALLGAQASLSLLDVDIDGQHLGEGYGVPTSEMLAAVRLLARTEGLLVDPVYGGKAFAGLLADIRDGAYRIGDDVIFIMTGGLPGLFAYRQAFDDATSC